MKIFVTGATGFIGKHLVKKLVGEGNDVTVNLYGEEKSPFNSTIKKWNLDENEIEKDIEFLISQSFDGILHLASLFLVNHKPEQAIKLIDSNLRFSTYILECATQAKINWFINTGTFWQHFQNKDYSPVNLYAASKQAFESIAQYYIETKDMKFVTIKLCDTFGPQDTRPKIFNLWDKVSKTGEPLKMSQGNQIIDISYISDIVSAYYTLANYLQNENFNIKSGDVYAIKSRKRYTLKELAAIYERITRKKLNIIWGAREYREREVMIPWERGKPIPGWRPEVSFKSGIRKIIEE